MNSCVVLFHLLDVIRCSKVLSVSIDGIFGKRVTRRLLILLKVNTADFIVQTDYAGKI